MKIHRYWFSILLTVAMMPIMLSCTDRLDIKQKGVVDIDDFYKTDADAEGALVAAYESFMCNVLGRNTDVEDQVYKVPYKIMLNMCADDVYYGSGNYGDHEYSGDLNEFRYDTQAEMVSKLYTGLYLSVYTCNLIIDHFGTADSPVKKRCVAESRVLRAYDYFLLAHFWGTPTFVDHVLTPGEPLYNCDRDPRHPMSHEDLVLWIANECMEASDDLDERRGTDDKHGAVHITKGFAWALAGKAFLFAGKYAEAKDVLYRVIASGKYDLVPGERFMDNFHIEGDANEEKVFEVNFEYNAFTDINKMMQRSTWMDANAWNWRSSNFKSCPAYVYCGTEGWGGLGVTQAFGDEFFANDGHSARFDASLIHIDDAVYGMEYADTHINAMTLEEKKQSKEIGISDVSQGLYGNSFWLQLKQMIRAADTDGQKYGNNVRLNNYIIMRYAEVLLLYAEACLQSGDADTALQYVNMIQRRAGSKTISKTIDMDVLKREKHYELFLEGVRWFDIMRWHDADAIATLKQAGHAVPHLYDKLFRTPLPSDENIVWEHGTESQSRFYLVHTHAAMDAGRTVGFQEGKHELFPFPQQVKDKNPNLRQNPNW